MASSDDSSDNCWDHRVSARCVCLEQGDMKPTCGWCVAGVCDMSLVACWCVAGVSVMCGWEIGGACGWHVRGGQGVRCVGAGWLALCLQYVMIDLICRPLCLPSWWLTASHTYQGSYHIKNS